MAFPFPLPPFETYSEVEGHIPKATTLSELSGVTAYSQTLDLRRIRVNKNENIPVESSVVGVCSKETDCCRL